MKLFRIFILIDIHTMKNAVIFMLLFLYSTRVIAQAPAIQWEVSLGGSGDDIGGFIQQTTDGGYIVAGSSFSNDGEVTGNHGEADYWVVKLSASSSIQWQKCLGGSGYDGATGIQQTTDGGYIVAGSSNSNDGQVNGNHGGYDYWVVKINNIGAIQWQKCLGGSGDDEAYSVAQTTDGGFIILGFSSSTDGDVTGNHGSYDYWVVKINDTGAIQWEQSYGGSGDDFGAAIQQTVDGGYIMTGNTASFDGEVSGNHGGSDFWVVKINDTGAIQWDECLGGSAEDDGQSIQQTTDGGYIVAGYTASYDYDVSGNHGGEDDYWVVKISDSGAIQWQTCLGGSQQDEGNFIQQTLDGGYIVTGFTASDDDEISGNHGASDFWAVKLNNAGVIQWQKCMGGSAEENSNCIQQTTDSGYIITGVSNSNDGDVTGNHGQNDYWVVKLYSDSNAGMLIASKIPVTIMPNPTTGVVYTSVSGVNIKVYNTLGQFIKEAVNTDEVSIAEFPNGVYFIEVFNQSGQLLNRNKIIKE